MTLYSWIRQVSLAIGLMLLLPGFAAADIIVTPPQPQQGQPVRIEFTRQYVSEATIESATITRQGNTFTIEQVVDVACGLPAAPRLTSAFDIGSLAAGVYSIEVQVEYVSSSTDPICDFSPISESSGFVVGGLQSVAVPGPTFGALLLLIGTIVLGGVLYTVRLR